MPLSLAAAADDLQRLSWTLRRKPLESFLAPQAGRAPRKGAAACWSATTVRWSRSSPLTGPAP